MNVSVSSWRSEEWSAPRKRIDRSPVKTHRWWGEKETRFSVSTVEPVWTLRRLRAATSITLFVTWVSVRDVGPNQSQPESQCSAAQITLFITWINSSGVAGNNISFFLIMFSGSHFPIRGSVTSVLGGGPGGCWSRGCCWLSLKCCFEV